MKSSTSIIGARLAQAADQVAVRYTAFMENPSDPETNHKFRVSIRTLRSLIDFASPWQKENQNERVQRNLKRVVKRTSRLRELDVLCEMAQAGGASEELVAFCQERAARERAAVLKSLKRNKYTSALESALDETCSINWRKRYAKGKHALDAEEVRRRYDELATALEADLAELDENDYEAVHDIRKRAKQVRYVSEQFSDLLGEGAAERAKHMKGEQDRLGAICDAKVNREIVEAFIVKESMSPTLAAELSLIVA